jgi:hypothetical protein
VTLLVSIPLGLDAFQNRQADLSPISYDAAGFQMPNVNGFAVPVVYTDVGMGIATNNRPLNTPQLDRASEVPVLFSHLDGGRGNGVEMHSLQRTYPTGDSSRVDLLLFYYFPKTLKKQIIPIKHDQDCSWSRFRYEILHLISSFQAPSLLIGLMLDLSPGKNCLDSS